MKKMLALVLTMVTAFAVNAAWAGDDARAIVVAYVFSQGAPVDPAVVDATRVTHVHHAFSRIVDSAVAFSRRHALDGIDIDWEYPGLPGAGNPHTPEDGRNFTLLLRELRSALDALAAETGRARSLAIASGGFPDYLAASEIGAWDA